MSRSMLFDRLPVVVVIALVGVLLGPGCSRNSVPSGSGTGTRPSSDTASQAGTRTGENTDASGQRGSEAGDLVAKAKQEGTVVIYAGGHTREQMSFLAEQFEKKYGVKVVSTRKPTGDILRMLASEQAAGNIQADVVSLADPASFTILSKQGLLEQYRVPNWNNIVESLRDPAGFYTPFTVNILGLAYNTRLVAETPTSWGAATDSRWRSKVVHANPAASGTTAAFVNGLVKTLGWDYYKRLAANKPLVVDSGTAVPQMVITGEVAFGLPGAESVVLPAITRGEPIKLAYPEEGSPVSLYALAVVKGAKHPNAARLFVNFHTEAEVQRALAEQLASRPVLQDIKPPPGMPEMEKVKTVLPDFAWLLEHARDQASKWQALMEGKE